jgi:hypothetical protein
MWSLRDRQRAEVTTNSCHWVASDTIDQSVESYTRVQKGAAPLKTGSRTVANRMLADYERGW